jgi:DNA invertase Pin-like site-specific DNA recombinase
MIRERTLSGIKAARAAGKIIGRPRRVFRRDEVVRLRDVEGLSWRAIGTKLDIQAMTAVGAYKTFNTENGTCTETASPKKAAAPLKGRPRKLVYENA